MAINNRLVKLITISAGACLLLGSLAGCKPAEEPEEAAAASEAQEESETETEAPQASVATSESETSEAAESSDDFVIEPEYLELDSEEQTYANKYITNFVEQYFFDFDRDSASTEQLLDFVHIHLKINAYDQISYETKGLSRPSQLRNPYRSSPNTLPFTSPKKTARLFLLLRQTMETSLQAPSMRTARSGMRQQTARAITLSVSLIPYLTTQTAH